MASKGIEFSAVVVLIITLICDRASGQSGCTSTVVGLAPCLNFVTGNSPNPPSSCCSQLASVVQSQPQCLCSLLNGGGSSLGISINQTLALSLPAACNVQTPPVSQCDAANNAPASSPSSPPAYDTPNTANLPSFPGGGSKTVPTAGGTSAASSLEIQLHFAIFFIFIASFSSNFLRF